MALKIRLQRRGKKGNPVYKLVVAEAKFPRDGRFVEALGHYDPVARGQAPVYQFNMERVDHWLKQGAQPTDTVKALLRKARKVDVTEAGHAIAYTL